MSDTPSPSLTARYVDLMLGWPMVLLQAAGTLAGVGVTVLLAGALLFSGRPEPTPFFLYAGYGLVALTIPMLIAVILRALGRGRTYRIGTQSLLALANLMFWGPFLVILIPQL